MLCLSIALVAASVHANVAPNAPVASYPQDNTANIPISKDNRAYGSYLIWRGTDPDHDPLLLTHEFYFGNASTNLIIRETSGPKDTDGTGKYLLQDQLAYSQAYFWKVIVVDPLGARTEGPIWRFTAEQAPIQNPPVLVLIGNRQINEGQTLTFTISATDANNDPLTYSATGLPTGASFTPATRTFAWTPGFSQANAYSVTFNVSDGTATDSETITITVNDVTPPQSNGAPTVSSFSPSTSTLIAADNVAKNFSVTASDPEGSTLTYQWYLNNNAVAGQTANSYSNSFATAGTFGVKVAISDGTNVVERSWTVTVSTVPVATTFDGSTTNFAQLSNLNNVTNVTLEKSAAGKIAFGNSALNLSDVADVDSNVVIANGLIGINTQNLPQLNKPATLTMYNVNFATTPTIFYTDGFTTDKNQINNVCTFCSVVSFQNNRLVFTASHFTTFAVKNVVASKLAIRDLDVKVADATDRNVENGETVSKDIVPGDTIELTLDVENLFANSERIEIKDIRIEAVFKKIDVDDEDIEKESDEFDLNEDDHVKKTLTFSVPHRVKEDKYEMDIKVEGKDEDGNTHRVDWTIFFEVKKKNHDVSISRLFLSPQLMRCDASTNLELEITNTGDKSEDDAGYEIVSNMLDINIQKSNIALDDDPDDEDSKYRESVKLTLDKDLEPGIYQITVKSSYDGKITQEKRIDLTVEQCSPVAVRVPEPDTKVVVSTDVPATPAQPKEQGFLESSGYLILVAGIYVLLIAIAIYAMVYLVRKR